jgi:betaine-aldehyde dehydrogenase
VLRARHLIGGEWVAEGETFESHSPGDRSLLRRAPIAGTELVEQAVSAARQAFDDSDWRERRAADRASVLLELGRRLDDAAENIARLIATEMGKPYRLALEREVRGAVDKCRYFVAAARAKQGEVTGASPAHILDLTVPGAVGVCALIIPWNDPVDLAVRKLGAALAAGCSAIVKPSDETPASTEALIRLLDDLPGLPPGVVNLVHGPGDPTGSALAAHPGVDMVSLTGSTATGRRVMAAAAGTLKRLSLQCSGKASSLVFADCELDKALDALAFGAFLYGGQSCTAGDPDHRRAAALRRVRRATCGAGRVDACRRSARPGHADRPARLGAPCRARAAFLETVAPASGTVVTGGTIEGLLVAPTIVAGVPADAAIATEEVFGRVVCVFAADEEDEAVALANAARYGLAASVWTTNLDRALRVSRRLDAGDVWVNTHYVRQPKTPFGGWKESGAGRELGLSGVREYVAYKRIAFDASPEFHLRTWWERGA